MIYKIGGVGAVKIESEKELVAAIRIDAPMILADDVAEANSVYHDRTNSNLVEFIQVELFGVNFDAMRCRSMEEKVWSGRITCLVPFRVKALSKTHAFMKMRNKLDIQFPGTWSFLKQSKIEQELEDDRDESNDAE